MAQSDDKAVETVNEMAPGDEAPAGTPGTGEDVCPACNGDGTVDGAPCSNCEGTGKIVSGVGGA
jgi:RecJ-like exonuclease